MTERLTLDLDTVVSVAIRKKLLTKKQVADHIGITAQSLWLKLTGKNEFKANEIRILCELLDLNSDIFIREAE